MESVKEQRIPTWKQWADVKVPQFRLRKTPPERKLTLNEMSNELGLCVLEEAEVEKVFKSLENDSSTICFKLVKKKSY